MGLAIGMAEFRSIVIGIETADKMIKSANVEVLMTKTVCPGKFVVMLSGSVENIKEAVNTAQENAEKFLLDYFVIPNIHESIPAVFGKKIRDIKVEAIGVMEFTRAASGIKALDYALKSANVEVIKLNFGGGISGKCYFIISGSVSDVKEAVIEAKQKTASTKIMYSTVIPNPAEDLIKNLK